MMINKIKKYVNSFVNWNPPMILWCLLVIIFVLFGVFYVFRIDNDFWFLINLGKYILNNGFPTVEPFTIHNDFNFMVQQWGTDIIFYSIYSKFGVYGIYLLVTFISFLIFLLIYKFSMLISENKKKFSLLISLGIFFLFLSCFITTRPQVFDILLLILELYLLELYIKKNNKLYLMGLPFISLLMINLHCSIWFMLFVFLLPYFVEKIVKFGFCSREEYKLKPLIFVGIIMFLVGFINPYGVDSIKYLFNSYGVDVINCLVSEMKPLTFVSIIEKLIFGLIFVVFISYYCNKDNKIKLRYLLLFLGTCYLALMHFRGALFLFVVSIVLLSYNFKKYFKNRKVSFWYSNKYMNCFIVSVIILTFGYYGYILYDTDLVDDNRNFLSEVADYLDENADNDIKLFTDYNTGGYMEYRGYKCYLDPRAEVFLKVNNKKEDILLEYIRLESNQMYYKDFLDKYNFDYMVVSEVSILYLLLEDVGYEAVLEVEDDFFDVKYKLFKKI